MRIAEAMRNGKVNWRMEYDTEKRIDTSTR
jgi:hypothetical protein